MTAESDIQGMGCQPLGTSDWTRPYLTCCNKQVASYIAIVTSRQSEIPSCIGEAVGELAISPLCTSPF